MKNTARCTWEILFPFFSKVPLKEQFCSSQMLSREHLKAQIILGKVMPFRDSFMNNDDKKIAC